MEMFGNMNAFFIHFVELLTLPNHISYIMVTTDKFILVVEGPFH